MLDLLGYLKVEATRQLLVLTGPALERCNGMRSHLATGGVEEKSGQVEGQMRCRYIVGQRQH